MSPPLWARLASRLGPPVFAATLVTCLVMGRYEPLHGVLLVAGVLLIALGELGSRAERTPRTG